MTYCAHKSSTGWLCVLAQGHDGDHMSVDNSRLWEGTPGAPVFWRSAKTAPIALDPTLTQVEAGTVAKTRPPSPTGDPCTHCGGPMMRTGTCSVCLDCGESGGCS